jgi:hypothetical protein
MTPIDSDGRERIAKVGPIEIRGRRREKPLLANECRQLRTAIAEAVLPWLTPVVDWLSRLLRFGR